MSYRVSRSATVPSGITRNWTGFVVNASVTVVLTPYMLDHLGAARCGVWIVISSIIGYCGFLDLEFRAGVTRYLTRFLAVRNYEGGVERLISILVALSLLGALMVVLNFRTADIQPRSNIKNSSLNIMANASFWPYTSGALPSLRKSPILIISSTVNPFSGYYAEILRTEGFNSFNMSDISGVTPAMLNTHDVVILGDMPLTASQVAMLSDWVTGGGNLITMRPDKKLAGLLGLEDKGTTISNAYLLVDTSSGPGRGIVDQSIQFHGAADCYTMNGALKLAALYADANTATSNPAVTLMNVGANGGKAAAFTYDLARSVVYTRQGNPAWSGQERDANVAADTVIRSDDLFFGAARFNPKPDWVDLNKVAIPQADEQQRLLANLIIRMNFEKVPLPRFWYLPRSLAAVVVMTGDDHAHNGTAGRFNHYQALSPPNCSVENWECIRGTSYSFINSPLSNEQASVYNAAGFEVALHVDTNCADWTPTSLESFYSTQLDEWKAKYFSLPAPVTHRVHCVAWSDFATQPAVELNHGIRLDTTYYYWPSAWNKDRPGMFTGSGMPMRFADAHGTLIDVYQATTQLTDESGQSYPFTIDTLLDRAIGPEGYYGVFTVNAHTDAAASSVSDAVVNSARARGVPVISAKQLLTWLDGRNSSSFYSIAWNGTTLRFSIDAARGATGLTAMVPVPAWLSIAGVKKDGSPIVFTTSTLKGIRYARFPASTGSYQVRYAAASHH